MKKRYPRMIREFAETSAMTFMVFLFLILFVIQGFRVYGTCMEPNIVTGQRLLGNKFIYRFEMPKRGDIVVFKYPLDRHRIFVKRVIGLPGETIEIRKGMVFIDHSKLSEKLYVKNPMHGDFPAERIPFDSVFVLGDNRDQSNDSRYWGYLPISNIEAKVWIRYWPLNQLGVLH